MRKKIFPIITAILVIIATLGGCSCAGASILTFNNDVTKELSVKDSETYVYDVEYVTEYGEHFQKSSSVDDDLLKITAIGTYTVKFEVLDSGATEIKNLDIQSDILTDPTKLLEKNDKIFKLTSNLEIKTKYSSKFKFPDPNNPGTSKDEIEENEYIRSTVYFLPISYSFNPIYSTTKGYTSFIDLSSNGLAIGYSYYDTEVKYNFNNYTTKSEYGIKNDKGEYTNSDKTTGTYAYTFKSVIDNNMLLFAIRNLSFSEAEEYVIPTVHTTYGVSQPLSITADKNSYDYDFNGEKVKAKEYSIVRNVQNYTGSPQFAVVQQDKTDNLANKTLLLKYVAPMSSLSSYVCLGGLKYTLKP